MATDQTITSDRTSSGKSVKKRVLNAGSGPFVASKIHPVFVAEEWDQVRLDADASVRPDLVGSIADMRDLVPDSTFDAVWSSHSLEHLYAHEVTPALKEFRRILKQDGFALITTPDLESVARLVVEGRIDDTAYVSPAGPISALDMMFGHSGAIKHGSHFMAHNTGFTCDRLGRLILESGFPEAHIIRRTQFDLWALATMPDTDHDKIFQKLGVLGINFAE
jgi:predicted SAM-dependent methyltransferase